MPSGPGAAGARPERGPLEVVQSSGPASTRGLEDLLGKAPVRIREVSDGRQRSVVVAKADLDILGTARREGQNLYRIASDPPTHRVHEMATFADEAGTLEFDVPVPAIRRESSRVDKVPGVRRLMEPTEPRPHLHEEGSEATIETDHDPVVSGRIHRRQDSVELVDRESERLFDEDCLSRFERAAGHVGMRAVSSDNEDGIDRVIPEAGARIGAGGAEAEFALGIDS